MTLYDIQDEVLAMSRRKLYFASRYSDRELSAIASFVGETRPWYYPEPPLLPFAHLTEGHPYHDRATCLTQLALEDPDFSPDLYELDEEGDLGRVADARPPRRGDSANVIGIIPYDRRSAMQESQKAMAAMGATHCVWIFQPGSLVLERGWDVDLIVGHDSDTSLASTGDGTLTLNEMPHGVTFEALVDRGLVPKTLREQGKMGISPEFMIDESSWVRPPFSDVAYQLISRARLGHIALTDQPKFLDAWASLGR